MVTLSGRAARVWPISIFPGGPRPATGALLTGTYSIIGLDDFVLIDLIDEDAARHQ